MPTLTSKSQVTIPKAARERLGIGPGDTVEFVLVGDHVEVRPAARPSPQALGQHLFGRHGSGHGRLSRDRKAILKERLRAQHRDRR